MLSFFIINVALPADRLRPAGHLRRAPARRRQLRHRQATLLVVGGRLGDAFGRKRLFLIGLIGFTVMSLICAIAPTHRRTARRPGRPGRRSVPLMTPQVLASISSLLTGQHRARAMAMFGVAGGAAAAFGQILGGVLVEANVFGLGWRAVFLVNVPVGIVARGCGDQAAPGNQGRQGTARRPRRGRTARAHAGPAAPATHRRPPARLAAVDLALPRSNDPGCGAARRTPAPG